MCRHLAYIGPARSLSSLLFDAPHSLAAQSLDPKHQDLVTENPDGWGVGWWDHAVRPEPARYRTTEPIWVDPAFCSVADVVRSSAFVAAARAATPPLPVVETGNAPFTEGPWLFSLNGFVEAYAGPLGDALLREVSSTRTERIQGPSDGELLFALLLDRLDAGAQPVDAVAGLIADLRSRGPARLNLLVSDGRQLIATAFGNSLFALADAGLAEGGVLVASEALDDHPGWVRVPDDSIIDARGTNLTISSLASSGGSA